MVRRRQGREAVWAVNCLLALGALGIFYRTVVAADPLAWPENRPAPPQVVREADGGCEAIWEAKLFVHPPPPPRDERPQFVYQGRLGNRVQITMNGQPLDPLRPGDLLPIRIDGRPLRLGRIEKDDVILILEDTVNEEIRVPCWVLPPGEGD